jgi:hypothetical protein
MMNKYKLNNSSSSVEYLQNDLLIEGESTDQYFENASYGFLDILGFGKINAFLVDVLYKRDREMDGSASEPDATNSIRRRERRYDQRC